ncbi:MAG: hypothetical protein RL656_739, partial [Bacteroidota bacterium]
SSQVEPLGIKSVRDNLKIIINSLPTAALTCLTIYSGKAILF